MCVGIRAGVCVRAGVHACACVGGHVRMRACLHVRMCACMHACVRACKICGCVRACEHMHAYVWVFEHSDMHERVHMIIHHNPISPSSLSSSVSPPPSSSFTIIKHKCTGTRAQAHVHRRRHPRIARSHAPHIPPQAHSPTKTHTNTHKQMHTQIHTDTHTYRCVCMACRAHTSLVH